MNLLFIILFFGGASSAQNAGSTASESRKAMLTKLLDYRFIGGTYSFEKLFYQTVKYPEIARNNCIQGIIIAKFTVKCDGKLSFITLKNPLHYGIEEEVQKFFAATAGHWNNCKDPKYEKFEIPILFKLEGTEINSQDALFEFEGKNPGYVCSGDDYYLEKAEKYLKKGKGKKAIENLDILIKRDPYNPKYYEMKNEAIKLLGKKKKKKKTE